MNSNSNIPTSIEGNPIDHEMLLSRERELLLDTEIKNSAQDDEIIDEIDLAFSYSKINNCKQGGKQIHCNAYGYYAYYETKCSGEFIFLDNKSKPRFPMGAKEKGLKFHISLANINDNIEQGWNIIKNIIVEYEVSSCKVIRDVNRSDLLTKLRSTQLGKEITIYAYKDTREPSKWKDLIQVITQKLAEYKITPGPIPPSNKKINGCNYISFHEFTDVVHVTKDMAPGEELSIDSAPKNTFQGSDPEELSIDSVPKDSPQKIDSDIKEIETSNLGSDKFLIESDKSSRESSTGNTYFDTTNTKESPLLTGEEVNHENKADDIKQEVEDFTLSIDQQSPLTLEKIRQKYQSELPLPNSDSDSIVSSVDSTQSISTSSSSDNSQIRHFASDFKIDVPNQPSRLTLKEIREIMLSTDVTNTTNLNLATFESTFANLPEVATNVHSFLFQQTPLQDFSQPEKLDEKQMFRDRHGNQ